MESLSFSYVRYISHLHAGRVVNGERAEFVSYLCSSVYALYNTCKNYYDLGPLSYSVVAVILPQPPWIVHPDLLHQILPGAAFDLPTPSLTPGYPGLVINFPVLLDLVPITSWIRPNSSTVRPVACPNDFVRSFS